MSKRLAYVACCVVLAACASRGGKAPSGPGGSAAADAKGGAAGAAAKRPRPETPEFWRADGQATLQRLQAAQPAAKRARALILFVGDGMGVSTVTAARILAGQQGGGDGEENVLSFEAFPATALIKTYNTDRQNPESAGSMTAMIGGVKTRGAAVGVDQVPLPGQCAEADGHWVKSLLEQAKDAGYAAGVVTNMRITHAVPAATYAHVSDRDWETDGRLSAAAKAQGCKDIARFLTEFDHRGALDVVFGGGRDAFLPKRPKPRDGEPDTPQPGDAYRFGAREDGVDLVARWRSAHAGNRYLTNGGQIATLNQDWASVTGPVLGLFASDNLQYEAERAQVGDEPSLSDMTKSAIMGLSRNPKGYVLVVDAGGIDRAHHAGDARHALSEAIELANAVQTAADMTSPGDTLIIVAASNSHTMTIGGLTKRGNPILGLARGGDDAFLQDGAGAPYTALAYANGPGAGAAAPTEASVADPGYRPIAAVPMTAETHGAEDTPLYARGPGQQWLHGVLEQNSLYWIMQAALDNFRPPPGPPPKRPWYKPPLPKPPSLPKIWPFGGKKDAKPPAAAPPS